MLLTFAAVCLGVTGCGSSGYAGTGITGLSTSAVTIDAGQQFPFTASLSGTALVSWSTSGAACSAGSCGTLSGTTGSAVTYTAPSGITSPLQVTLTASVAGTKNVKVSTITVNPDPVIRGTAPSGTVGASYSTSFTATGGTAPLTWSMTGALPAGLSFNASTKVISGTPTSAGTSSVTLQVVDSSAVPFTVKAAEAIVISAPGTTGSPFVILTGNPPAGTVSVPYTASIKATGGVTPYTFAVSSGALPAGLTLSAATGAITGVPATAGTSVFGVQAQDSAGTRSSANFSILINPLAASLKLNLATLPGATVGVPYSATIGVSGGSAPYTCQQAGGSLPAGLTLSSGCVVSGTPTVAGTSTLTVKASDASSPALTVTGPESITVSAATPALTLSNLPNATVGTPYSGLIGVAGGAAPYQCTLVSGTLPAGLTIAGCVVSGTPTVAGSVILNVHATDSASPARTGSGPVGLTINPAGGTLTITSPPDGTVGIPYSGPIGVAGGTAPYNCTLVSGTLPAGLSLSGCTISGTPSTPGSSMLTIKGTDSSSPVDTGTGPVTITIDPASAGLTITSPANATVNVPYTGTVGVTGGTGPYSCMLDSGTLPVGLTLAANCTVSGTPTVAGTATVQVHATDSASPGASKDGPVTITVAPVSKLSLTGSLPNATLGEPYVQTLLATGGVTPYSYSLTAGALPAGLTLSTAGVISGTPTAPGASSFTVTVTDTEPTPQTASLPLVLLVVYPVTPNDAELSGPYAYLFQGYDDVVAGVLAYQTAAVGSFTADGTGVISAGEMDANHESSNPAGNTVSSNQFLGTYTIGTDNRGSLTITSLDADGATGTTSTYAITLKSPVAPATIAVQADLIEFDNDNLQGTKGSGSMLAQQPAAFPAGLNGSYAFGLSGDTPCLPACTIGISAGPAAAVGAFTTDAKGSIASGTSDANIASTNYPDAALTGSYGISDANGRLSLEMTTAKTPAGSYPADYAVYLVSANEALVMSTDKHSAYVLLAGTAQLQTQAAFTNASLNSAIIGYENAQSNPGLLGTTLGNTLNLSTATIFRATGNGAGTCNTTNVDVAGLTSLVNGLTGLGSGVNTLNAVLGTYQSTGTSACTVASNGRGVLNYPVPSGLLTTVLTTLGLSTAPPAPREFYLVSPNNGYFLETGYAGLGRFEAQTGGPFSLATLDGTYVYASQPASSLASINSSGTLTADGAGNATTTQDLNIGVGTINLLQTGITNASTYALTSATAGRYTLGTTTVLYAITPDRFVLVDTNPATTSPSISLLY